MKLGVVLFAHSHPLGRCKLVLSRKDVAKHNAANPGLELDPNLFNFLEALSRNRAFEKEILNARKKCGLPPVGLPPEDCLKEFIIGATKNKAMTGEMYSLISKAEQAILKRFKLNPAISLNLIIPYGIYMPVFDELPSISLQIHDCDANGTPYNDVDKVSIDISRPISKHAVIKYINANWNAIEKGMKRMTLSSPIKHITQRDFEILDLKDKKNLLFTDVADIIHKKYSNSDPEAKINEDSVKTAYSRAKKTISSLFRPIKR